MGFHVIEKTRSQLSRQLDFFGNHKACPFITSHSPLIPRPDFQIQRLVRPALFGNRDRFPGDRRTDAAGTSLRMNADPEKNLRFLLQ